MQLAGKIANLIKEGQTWTKNVAVRGAVRRECIIPMTKTKQRFILYLLNCRCFIISLVMQQHVQRIVTIFIPSKIIGKYKSKHT